MTRMGTPRALPDLTSAKPAFTLVELAGWLEASLPLGAAATFTGVCTDSRAAEPGDLYLALPGAHAHGLDFEAQACARGAVAAVSDRAGAMLPTVVVHDPRRCAGPISARIHSYPSQAMDVYAVTGTNGKTSTTYLLNAALTAAGEKVGTLTGISISGPGGVFPATRTTPEAAPLQKALARFRDEGATAAVMEVSSHAVAHRRIDGTRFAAVGFTNLSSDHLDFHGSMEKYFAVKSELFTPQRAAAAAIGIDDDYGRRLADTIEIPCWTWSAIDTRAEIFGDAIECTASGTSFTARTPYGSFDIRLPLLGPHQVRNALAAIGLLAANGKDLGSAVLGFEQVSAVPGRLERIDAGQPFLALVDYMHNTAGQRQLLPYLRTLTTGRVIVVVGATGDRDPSKRFPLGATAAEWADLVIVSDESPYSEDAACIRNEVAAGAIAAQSSIVVVEPDRRRAFDLAVANAQPGDVIVVAGRGCDTEQIFGDIVLPFDDREELLDALQSCSTGVTPS